MNSNNKDNKQIMEHSFSKSVSYVEKCKKLVEIVTPDDTVAILITADPDSIASALALKRIFWRKAKKTLIYHINPIKRSDNLALIKLLKIDLKHIKELKESEITKWAIVDSQPHHDEIFSRFKYDIIIDHHPPGADSCGHFVDIKEEYGANATILAEYLKAAKIKPSPKLATALFYGIKTDTDNFARPSTPHDINAFRHLYSFVNLNIIKKIESSEITRKTIKGFRTAIENLTFYKDIAYIDMGKVNDPDILVIIADFFQKMAEATWSIVSGQYGQKIIIIFRHAGFRMDAGKTAQRLFGELGSAGGHESVARVEIPLSAIDLLMNGTSDYKKFIYSKIKGI